MLRALRVELSGRSSRPTEDTATLQVVHLYADPASPTTKVRGYADAVPKKPTAQMIAEAKAAGVEVTISKAPPKTTGGIVLLPGHREAQQ